MMNGPTRPTGRIVAAAGPVVRAVGLPDPAVSEVVRVGRGGLLGEIIALDGPLATIQVYEETTGLAIGDPVVATGGPLVAWLGPGLLGAVFDGLQRPLDRLAAAGQWQIRPGAAAVAGEARVDRGAATALGERRWRFEPRRAVGDHVGPGDVLGIVREGAIEHRILVPPDHPGGRLDAIEAGDYRVDEAIGRTEGPDGAVELRLAHAWPVRRARPVAARRPVERPLVTGQRVLDLFFPVARGGTAVIPGGFGTGKTVVEQQLARWSDADVVVYVGCGERGNEMAELLATFPELVDPRTGRPLLERTVLIANTSNMPVAAREASIYSAITVAEYFRDQGLHVALMADSTTRWAEALREVSGRLGELPGEGGYPAYLGSRLAEFYERAARVRTLGGAIGSVTVVSAISPAAGDFSEPVTSHTRRFVRSYWALDTRRAQARFYPAIHPLQSYAENASELAAWWSAAGNPEWLELRRRFLALLDEQARAERMARIIGKDALPPAQRLTLVNAGLVNDAFLRQSAFSEKDRYCSPARQATMMKLIARFIALAQEAASAGIEPETIERMACFRRLRRMGEEIGEHEPARHAELAAAIEREFAALAAAHEASHAA